MDIWDELYKKACSVQNARTISSFVDAGSVAAAVMSESGKVYLGVCIDTCSSLGMCAERNAIANMITCGESEIVKIVAVMTNGRVGPPCGACREFIMQLSLNNRHAEVLMDRENKTVTTIGELTPNWWGDQRYN